MEELNQLRDRMNDLKKEMARIAKENLPLEFKRYFDVWPEAEAFRWRQYTPYFNDGEPCVFSLHGVHVKIGDEGGDYGDGFLETYDFERDTPERNRMADIEGTLEMCEDVLQIIFGDHCQVTIWRDRNEAEVEDYEHD